MGEYNIAPNTQIGRIVIDHKVYEFENFNNVAQYSRGGEFIENLVCDNVIEFSKRWLGLAGVMEFLEDIQEYRSGKIFTAFGSYGVRDGVFAESPLIDLNVTPKATVQLYYPAEPAIYDLSSLKQHGLSNKFNDYNGGVGVV